MRTLVRLAVWGAASAVLGVLAVVLAGRRPVRPALVCHFAVQTAAWGLVDLALVAAGWRNLSPKDLNGYWGLREFLWLNVGLDVGYVGVGVTLATCGWALGRRLGLVGAGLGVVVQGLALVVLDAWLLAVLNRIQGELMAEVTLDLRGVPKVDAYRELTSHCVEVLPWSER